MHGFLSPYMDDYVVIDFLLLESSWPSINTWTLQYPSLTEQKFFWQEHWFSPICPKVPLLYRLKLIHDNNQNSNNSQLIVSDSTKMTCDFVQLSPFYSHCLTVHITAVTSPIYVCWIFNTHHAVSYCAYTFRVFRQFAYILSGLAGLSSHFFFRLHYPSYVCRPIIKTCWVQVILLCYEVNLLSTSRMSIWSFID